MFFKCSSWFAVFADNEAVIFGASSRLIIRTNAAAAAALISLLPCAQFFNSLFFLYTHCRYFALLPKDETRQLELNRQQRQRIRMRLELACGLYVELQHRLPPPPHAITCDRIIIAIRPADEGMPLSPLRVRRHSNVIHSVI